MSTPDPLAMLDVIEESRQKAMERREAAVGHLATVALQALVEGHPVRDIARRCGFLQVEAAQEEAPQNEEKGLFESFGLYMPRATVSPEERFAAWLADAVKRRVLEQLEERT